MVATDVNEQQRAELQLGEKRSEKEPRIIGRKKKRKVETNLTTEGDLLADERKEQKAPVKDDREQKSYGKENCSCGETKTTTRRVSLLRSGIRFACLFSVGRAFSLVLQSRT